MLYWFWIFLTTGKVDEKATQLHAIASLKVLLDATKPQDGANGTATCAGEGNNIGGGGDQAHDSGRASQGTEVGGDQRSSIIMIRL